MMKVLTYSDLRFNQIKVNGEIVYDEKNEDMNAFLNHAYRSAGINYAKFFKMDLLCKMGILATHFALKNNEELLHSQGTLMLFNNKSSSLDTDKQHWKTLEDKSNYFPSPAVFVYTLPNIILGELAIRYKLYGENVFFVSEKPDFNHLCSYAKIMMNKPTANNIIFGVVEPEKPERAFIVFAQKIQENSGKIDTFIPFNSESLTQLYNQ